MRFASKNLKARPSDAGQSGRRSSPACDSRSAECGRSQAGRKCSVADRKPHGPLRWGRGCGWATPGPCAGPRASATRHGRAGAGSAAAFRSPAAAASSRRVTSDCVSLNYGLLSGYRATSYSGNHQVVVTGFSEQNGTWTHLDPLRSTTSGTTVRSATFRQAVGPCRSPGGEPARPWTEQGRFNSQVPHHSAGSTAWDTL